MDKNVTKTLKQGTFWSSLSSVVVSVVSLFRLTILTRMLDASDFGLLALTTVVLSFSSLYVDLGLTSAVLHRKEINKAEFSGVFWSSVLLGIVAYFILFFASNLIADAYDERLLESLIQLMGVNIIVSSLGRQYNNLETKNLNFKFIAVVEVVCAVVSFLVAVFLAFRGCGVLALVYSQILATVVSTTLFITNGFNKRMTPFSTFTLNDVKPFVKIGVYNSLGQAVNFINKEIDILLFGSFVSIETLGVYNLIKQLVLKPAAIINPIVIKVATPLLASLQEKREEFKDSFLMIVRSVAFINTITYGLFFCLTPVILNIAFGEDFLRYTPLARTIVVYVFLMSLRSPMGTLTISSGHTKLEVHWALLNTIVVIPVLYIALQNFRIEQVVILVTIVVGLLYFVMWRMVVSKIIHISFKEFLLAHTVTFTNTKKLIKFFSAN